MSNERERTEWRYSCLVASSLLFGAMAVFMVLGVTDNLDAATRAGINRWASPNLTALAEGASFIGSVSVLFSLTALVAAGLWLGGRPRAALMLLLVMGIAAIVNNAIKLTFARARPEAFFGAVPDSYSFASGHALFSACFFSVVAGLIEAKLTSGLATRHRVGACLQHYRRHRPVAHLSRCALSHRRHRWLRPGGTDRLSRAQRRRRASLAAAQAGRGD